MSIPHPQRTGALVRPGLGGFGFCSAQGEGDFGAGLAFAGVVGGGEAVGDDDAEGLVFEGGVIFGSPEPSSFTGFPAGSPSPQLSLLRFACGGGLDGEEVAVGGKFAPDAVTVGATSVGPVEEEGAAGGRTAREQEQAKAWTPTLYVCGSKSPALYPLCWPFFCSSHSGR